ncbi:Hypothetical predicted protein [Mytilus galloprovincialis]|uniref:Uncharacterized protein n=1 Tax=Mytilus galloprovincialis TaxID=29158 RepID=A0A8B6EUX3_MYTGA|nr:Hypothetical predicted protein [Mytilus galloprovincialis]
MYKVKTRDPQFCRENGEEIEENGGDRRNPYLKYDGTSNDFNIGTLSDMPLKTKTMEDIENWKEKDNQQNVSKNTQSQSIHDGSSGSSGVIDIESTKTDPEVTERKHCHDGILCEGRRGRFNAKMESDIPRVKPINKENVKKWFKKGLKPNVTKNPKLSLFRSGFSGTCGVIDMIDTIDRPGTANANSKYVRKGTYVNGGGINKPGERLPKAGAYAEAGVGEANAQWSIFDAEARGPNARAHAGATVSGVSAMATAGVGTASANAGPIGIQVGLQLDTGISIGFDGIEIKIFGIGFSIGPKTSISFLGNEVSVDFV